MFDENKNILKNIYTPFEEFYFIFCLLEELI